MFRSANCAVTAMGAVLCVILFGCFILWQSESVYEPHEGCCRYSNYRIEHLLYEVFYGEYYCHYAIEQCHFSEPEISISINDTLLTIGNDKSYWLALNEVNILTEPLLSSYASKLTLSNSTLVFEKRYVLADLPKIDVVVLSNVHSTQLIDSEADRLKALNNRYTPVFIVPLGWKAILEPLGVDEVREMTWREPINLDKNLRISYEPSQYFWITENKAATWRD